MKTEMNDLGERIYAVGTEGSIARIREMYPAMINWINEYYEESITKESPLFGYVQVCMEFEKRDIPKEHRKTIWEQTKFFTVLKIKF